MNESERERPSPEPPEFDAHGYVTAEVRYILDVLERKGIGPDEGYQVVGESLCQMLADRDPNIKGQAALLRLTREAVYRAFECEGMDPHEAESMAKFVENQVKNILTRMKI